MDRGAGSTVMGLQSIRSLRVRYYSATEDTGTINDED